MKLYSCSNCNNLLYFENNICLKCNNSVGFNPDNLSLVTLKPQADNSFVNIANNKETYRYCANAAHATCNWLVPAQSNITYCLACSLNRTIPALTSYENQERWKLIEVAKHRLVYSLIRLNLPVKAKVGDEVEGIAFDFMADESPKERVLTGHDNGVITLNIEEANEAERVKHKVELGERYRTLLGHFRHEIGHYYWDVLLKNGSLLEKYRSIFGNEEKDYSEALKEYYQNGAPADWSNNFISPYATSHSWEDWAETWAHYLHMMDTMETAYYFGISVHPSKLKNHKEMETDVKDDPYMVSNFKKIVDRWMPITFALNSLNRSMGHQDFYPFVISETVAKKLEFVHEVCHSVKK